MQRHNHQPSGFIKNHAGSLPGSCFCFLLRAKLILTFPAFDFTRDGG